VQQWYALADEALEDAIYDSQALRNFVGIDLAVESVPDATTLLKFRHLLEKQALTQVIFEQINGHLADRGMLMREGTIVDATIIAAPPSTKNKAKAQDRIVGPPEMHQTKKGNEWYFGMKAHIGKDADSGLVHSLMGTAANVAENNGAFFTVYPNAAATAGDTVTLAFARPTRQHYCSHHMTAHAVQKNTWSLSL